MRTSILACLVLAASCAVSDEPELTEPATEQATASLWGSNICHHVSILIRNSFERPNGESAYIRIKRVEFYSTGEGDWIGIDYDLPSAAAATGLSQYELLTGLGDRFERVWI